MEAQTTKQAELIEAAETTPLAEFTTTVGAMRSVLSRMGKVVSNNAYIPILGTVLMETGRSGVTVTGTDCDETLSIDMPAEPADMGKGVCIGAKDLKTCLLKRKAASVLSIAASSTLYKRGVEIISVSVSVDGANFKFGGLPQSDFPRNMQIVDGNTVAFPTETLVDAFSDMVPFMSKEETRFYLNGLYLAKTEAGLVRTVATDGHKLGKHDSAEAWPFEVDGVIVPRLAVGTILRVLKKQSSTVSLSVTKDAVVIAGDDFRFQTKTIDGTFLDYERVIPEYNSANPNIVLRAGEIRDAMTIVTTPSMCATFDFNAETVTSKDAGGNAAIEVPLYVITKNEAAKQVAYNAAYVGQIMALFDADHDVTFNYPDEKSPTRIECADWPEFLAVLMPMRI